LKEKTILWVTWSERISTVLTTPANVRQLLHDDRVLFAAYRVPHPLEHNVVLRVQTDEGYEPKEAVINAANVLLVQLTQLRSNFEQEWELKKLSVGDGEGEF
jgi:DNA-directed RNA polymerase II subunit RPB11